ncbi:MAG: radical SAM protein [Candidatus Aenigmarchaeota archaeon]|nr:radical SAM protein [Candidatus Aenigmarchaeota archaeon]
MVKIISENEGYDLYLDTEYLKNPEIAQTKDSLGRDMWKKVPYERNLLFTLVITDKCTLKCEHCFEEAGPKNNTFLSASEINKLAEESIDIFKNYKNREIRITGGDPFLHPDLYQIIESFSERKDLLEYNTLDVETNGWWATDDKTTEKYIEMLKESGTDLLSMTVDYFHCKQDKFDIYKHFDRINKIAGEHDLQFRDITIDMCLSDDEEIKKEAKKHEKCCWGIIPEVMPIGNARQLPEKYWEGLHPCRAEGCRLTPPTIAEVVGIYVHTDEITIQKDGNVYPCNSGKDFEYTTLSMGNIYEELLPEIIENQNNPIVQLLQEEGLRGLSEIAGIPLRKHWEMYYKFTPCGLCHELLRVYGKKISENL